MSNSSTETDYSNSIESPSPRPDIESEFLDQQNTVKQQTSQEHENLETKLDHLQLSQSMDRLGKTLYHNQCEVFNNF